MIPLLGEMVAPAQWILNHYMLKIVAIILRTTGIFTDIKHLGINHLQRLKLNLTLI